MSKMSKMSKINKRSKMSRIRLNSEYRNKIDNRMRLHLEQENTQEKDAFLPQGKEYCGSYIDNLFTLGEVTSRKTRSITEFP